MTSPSEATGIFSSLSEKDQLLFLVHFAYELTIAARDTYAALESGLTDPERMREFNEVQHRVCQHAAALLRNDPDRRPDEVLVRVLLEQGSAKLRSDTSKAFAQAITSLRHH